MRAILIVLVAVVVSTKARPDLSLGYNHNGAQDTYVGATPLTAGYHDDSAHAAQHYVADGHSAINVNLGSTTADTASAAHYLSGSQQPLAATGYTSVSSSSSASASSSAHQVPAVQPSQLPPIITKSFYFEAAPEEPEETQAPRFVSVGRAQKNYKVIFIKAPSYGLNSQIIPVLPQNEEKTIIYVLSKKPELNQDIELPPVPTTEPTKPEIFFVKYKSEQEALDAQHKIKHVYETNQPSGAGGDGNFRDDRYIQSIVSDAVPNVYSAASPLAGSSAGFGSSSGSVLQNQLSHAAINSALGHSVGNLAPRFDGDEADEAVLNGHFEQVADVVQNVHSQQETVDASIAQAIAGDSNQHEANAADDLIMVNFVGVDNGQQAHGETGGFALNLNEPEPEYLLPIQSHE